MEMQMGGSQELDTKMEMEALWKWLGDEGMRDDWERNMLWMMEWRN